jgi:uncharacterized protein with ParB-like and HNH nuclease domain/predicted transport protein
VFPRQDEPRNAATTNGDRLKAAEANFLRFLNKSDQLEVPIYQRTYSWTRPECLELWNDIVRAAHDDVSGHFIGSIVYIDTGIYQVTGANTIEVIDGQQRLTTISLLLLAVAHAMAANSEGSAATARKLVKDYLLQDEDVDPGVEGRYKLLLTKSDRETYMRLVDGLDINPAEAPRLVDTFDLFEDQVRRTTLSFDQVLAGLGKLLMVDIALEKDHDNPQLIFESLNSTGLDLSQADLIRNYVLMGQPPKLQKEIYISSWYPLEQSFPAEAQDRFDSFMRDYLTMRTGQIPKIDRVYESFKTLAQSSGLPTADLVADIYKHSKNWVELAFDRAKDAALREAIADLNQLKVDVAYPFLLEVMDDHDDGTISDAELVAAVRLLESYVFRRALAGIPTNILNKTFAALAREMDKDSYLESLEAALLLKESYARMPTDEEVRSALLVKDVYNFRSRNYLLGKLENHGRKERVDVLGYTIEHVLPQNPDLSPEWQEELGLHWRTVQEKYLHTLGNLTLTGYNAELSDRPFREKLTMKGGFRDSPLRLNHYLAQLEQWNDDEIERRAGVLADQVLTIWPAPRVPEDTLAKYRKTKAKASTVYSLDDHPALAGPIRPLFDGLRQRVQNLDAGVHEQVRKQYIAYQLETNFVEVVPLASALKLYLDIGMDELDDPNDLARDVTTVGHWGTGSVEVRLKTTEQLEDVMSLIRQSFELQGEEGYEEPQWSQAGVERVVEEASDPAVQEALLQVVEAAARNGLYPRPWKRSLMVAPPVNRSRALFTLSVRDDDRVDLYCVSEAFQTFYGLEPREVERLLGPAGPTALQAAEIAALSERLDELMIDAEPVTDGPRSRPPWNGRDFYVTIGDRPWEDAERYGYVAAGGGETYTKPLENLFPGARVFLYKPYPVKGFVGVGLVKERSRSVTEFEVEVDGQRVPIREAPLTDRDAVVHDADDPALREHLVRVEWLKTRPVGEAVWQPGLFTNQVPVCKLRDQETIEYLEQAFGLEIEDSLPDTASAEARA